MKELVTIILPVYNGEKYIEQMLNSIYLQDYRPIEVIISDDASKDKTVRIICTWLKNKCMNNIYFKVVKNKRNIGLSGNISKAAKYVHGKYLFLADQDDLWVVKKVSEQVEYLKENTDCEMCICDRSIIDEKNRIVCKSLMRYEHINFQKRGYKEVLNHGSEYPANTICLKTEHLNKLFPIPHQVCEHDTFIAIMAVHFGNIGFVRKPLTLYRIHDNNVSGNYALELEKNPLRLICVVMRIVKRTKKRNSVDPVVIKDELKKRFNEYTTDFSTSMYEKEIKSVYIASAKYLWRNFYRWKRFV